MDSEQALDSFWNSFGVPAWDENTVPDDAPFKKITYEIITNEFGVPTTTTVSIYDRSDGWKSVTDIFHLVKDRLKNGGVTIQSNDGIIWLKPGTPFCQRFGDVNDTVRRLIVNIEIEYLEV